MVQAAPVPVLSSAEARLWDAGLLKNHEQEWAAMPAACWGWSGLVGPLIY